MFSLLFKCERVRNSHKIFNDYSRDKISISILRSILFDHILNKSIFGFLMKYCKKYIMNIKIFHFWKYHQNPFQKSLNAFSEKSIFLLLYIEEQENPFLSAINFRPVHQYWCQNRNARIILGVEYCLYYNIKAIIYLSGTNYNKYFMWKWKGKKNSVWLQ